MTARKSFFITIRMFVVLSSLMFLGDAFNKWDGTRIYMNFEEFLPDLSLTFIIWTVLVFFFGVVCWIMTYLFFRITSRFAAVFSVEKILFLFMFIVIPYMIKLAYLPPFPLSELLGLSRTAFACIVLSCFYVVMYSLSRITPKFMTAVNIEQAIFVLMFVIIPIILIRIFYPGFSLPEPVVLNQATVTVLAVICFWFGRKYIDKIIHSINYRIAPLVWLFTLVFIISLPLSFLSNLQANAYYAPADTVKSVHSGKKQPNIILVTMDALTARDMQLYGYDLPTTPFISEWAKGAAVFEKAYSASNWTTPSSMSLMTGKRVWTHRISYQASFSPVKKTDECLPRVLRDYGYDVYGFVQSVNAHPVTLGMKSYFLIKDAAVTFKKPAEFWIDRLEELFRYRRISQRWIFTSNKIIQSINPQRPDQYSPDMPAELVYDRFLDYIAEKKEGDKPGRPFFAWLHVFPPHYYFLPPAPYMDRFEDSDMYNSLKKQYEIIGTAERKQKDASRFWTNYLPENQMNMNILRKRYDEYILYSDDRFRSFLSRLSGVVDMSNVIIILSSDHGESFEHNYATHGGHHLYEALVHIPLIIKMPDNNEGKVIDMNVENTDIAPTILELAGISAPEWMEGRSLLPLIDDKPLDPRPVYSMQFSNNPYAGDSLLTKGTVAVWDGDYKLIYYMENDKSLLFDLKSDPDEKYNLVDTRPRILQRLRQLIDKNLNLANERIARSASEQ
jgi:arylsulfatase